MNFHSVLITWKLYICVCVCVYIYIYILHIKSEISYKPNFIFIHLIVQEK